MAEGNPFDFHVAPYCWRLLQPLAVHLLPFPARVSFRIVTLASLLLTPVLLFFLLRRLGFSPLLALIGFFAFHSFGYATKFVLFDFWLPDALSFLFITLLILLLLQGRWRAFALLLPLGFLAKESVLFALPLAYSLTSKTLFDREAFRRTALAALPALALFAIVRISIPALNDDPSYIRSLPETLRVVQHHSSSYEYGQLYRQIGEERIRRASPMKIAGIAVGTFGLYALLFPLLGGKRSVELFLGFLPLLILAPLQLLFAVNVERLLTIAFPALVPLILAGMERTRMRLRLPTAPFLLFPLLAILFNLLDPRGFSPPLRFQIGVVLISSLCIAALYSWRSLRFRFPPVP
jgi:hypothetical protein